MLSYFIPVILILFSNVWIVYITKHYFGECLPVTILSEVFLVYFSQLIFRSFWPGVLLSAAAGVSGFLLLIIKKDIRNYFSSYGLIAFVICCIFSILLDFNRTFVDFDEFWHWGLMIKESLRLDSFHCTEASNMIIHKDYPPFCPLVELLWCRLGMNYSEGLATSGLHIASLSMIVPPIAEFLSNKCEKKLLFHDNNVKETKSYKTILLNLFVLLLLLGCVLLIIVSLDFAVIFRTILADMPMGLIFAYLLFLVFSEQVYSDRLYFAAFLLGCSALVMTKQAGIALFMVSVFAFLLIGLNKQHDSNKKYTNVMIMTVICIFIPIFIILTWKVVVSSHTVLDIRAAEGGNGQFNLSKIDPTVYIEAVLTNNDPLLHDTFYSFVKALFFRNVCAFRFFPVSYAAAYVLLMFLTILLHFFNKEAFSLHKAGISAVIFTVGTLGYAFMLSVLFLFCFTVDEMQELRGYERYVDGFLLGEFMSLFMVMFSFRSEKTGKACIELLLCIILTAAAANTRMLYIMPQPVQRAVLKMKGIYRDNSELEYMAGYIAERTEENSSVVLIYDTGDNAASISWYGGLQSYLQYYVNDRKLVWGTDLFRYDYTNADTSDAVNQLAENDYVYIVDLNENVNYGIGYMCEEERLEEGRIYKINSTSKIPILIPVY